MNGPFAFAGLAMIGLAALARARTHAIRSAFASTTIAEHGEAALILTRRGHRLNQIYGVVAAVALIWAGFVLGRG